MARLQFPIFLLFLWGIALFHRREHRLFLQQMAEICAYCRKNQADAPTEALKAFDWRIIRKEETTLALKRAFEVRSREDILRYGAPVAFLAAALLLVQSWPLFFIYGALLGLKWFCVETVVSTTGPAFYEVRLFGKKLFAEYLKV